MTHNLYLIMKEVFGVTCSKFVCIQMVACDNYLSVYLV